MNPPRQHVPTKKLPPVCPVLHPEHLSHGKGNQIATSNRRLMLHRIDNVTRHHAERRDRPDLDPNTLLVGQQHHLDAIAVANLRNIANVAAVARGRHAVRIQCIKHVVVVVARMVVSRWWFVGKVHQGKALRMDGGNGPLLGEVAVVKALGKELVVRHDVPGTVQFPRGIVQFDHVQFGEKTHNSHEPFRSISFPVHGLGVLPRRRRNGKGILTGLQRPARHFVQEFPIHALTRLAAIPNRLASPATLQVLRASTVGALLSSLFLAFLVAGRHGGRCLEGFTV